MTLLQGIRRRKKRTIGFTLMEVMVCVFIAVVVFSGIICCYIQGDYRAEWSGYSLAAQALAIQQLEQAKAAVWDNALGTPKNEITNIVTTTWAQMDIPISGTNYIFATNYTTIVNIPIAAPSVSVYMVKVDTVWSFLWKGVRTYYTNTIADYYAPDTPDS